MPVLHDNTNDVIVPAKLSCQHPLCSLLIKKDIISAEKMKSITSLKPKHDLVDAFQTDLKVEKERREIKPPVKKDSILFDDDDFSLVEDKSKAKESR